MPSLAEKARRYSMRSEIPHQRPITWRLRLSRKGYRNVWTPNAELYHHESLTRGSEIAPAKRRRFEGECDAMRARWGDTLLNDPNYHPALSLVQGDSITYSSPRY